MKYQTRVYIYDAERAARLQKGEPLEKAYAAVNPTHDIAELANELNLEHLFIGQVLSTQSRDYEVKQLVPQIYQNKTRNLIVYLKEIDHKNLKK